MLPSISHIQICPKHLVLLLNFRSHLPSDHTLLPPPSAPILTFTFHSRRLVEREAKWNDGGSLQDDEGDILQSLPHKLQESLGLLWGNKILAISLVSTLQVCWIPTETWRMREMKKLNLQKQQRIKFTHTCTSRHLHSVSCLILNKLKVYLNSGTLWWIMVSFKGSWLTFIHERRKCNWQHSAATGRLSPGHSRC